MKWLYPLALMMTVSACGGDASNESGGRAENFPDYRYRLTVEVETPEGLKTGSSVIEVKTHRASALNIPVPRAVTVRSFGEAVAVDLPDNRTLFGLLRSEVSQDWARWIMVWLTPIPSPAPEGEPHDSLRDRFNAMLSNHRAIEIPAKFPKGFGPDPFEYPAMPMLVRFRDTKNPKTVVAVDPDNLAAAFGKGYRLRRITAQITDEPVTSSIRSKLPWLTNRESGLDNDFTETTNPTLPQKLKYGNFLRSYKK